ncbi:cephalosporin hydroxylase [Candidatus Giovannonibacteria bacterium]|nr:cephalosporin hydroxylase [Candidatus Giovannonibacteria bacterium]
MFLKYCVRKLHKYYYHNKKISKHTNWLGVRIKKFPTDCWVYQEIISELKPDVLIECGTKFGGSALFFSSIFDLVGNGRVITIDVQKKANLPVHPRINYIQASSVETSTVEKVRSMINNADKVMVILDSAHTKDHVFKEMEFYGPLVSLGHYMIVEDTNPTILRESGEIPGPDEAVKQFLKTHDEFVIDKKREKFLITTDPDGYLLKIK